MARPDTPHFDLPFRFAGSSIATVEQDTPKEVLNCVEAIVRYPTGVRDDLPEFGVPSQLFAEGSPDVELVRAQIATWEPRAELVVDEEMGDLDGAVRRILVKVGTDRG